MARRFLSGLCVVANCLSAGSIFTFPLFSPPLARALHLTASQTTAIASAGVLGEYTSAAGWGWVCDKRGPGAVSWAAAVLFGVGYGALGWSYQVGVERERQGLESAEGSGWMLLAFCYFLAGCATSASYFSSIITSTKSLPTRHSGLAIGIPCAIFGLSPLFLSALASHFISSPSTIASGSAELDPGRWLLFLAIFLTAVNGLGGLGLRVIPWVDEDELKAITEGEEEERRSDEDSGFVGSAVRDEEHAANERTTLLSHTKTTTSEKSHSASTLLSNKTFWLFGTVILLSTGPCEMVMATLGQQIESLLGVKIQGSPSSPSRALSLRSQHVQIISVANTVSRLFAGALSDWLSYAAAPHVHPPPPPPRTFLLAVQATFSRPPRVSRLLFVVVACLLLSGAFAYVAFALEQPSGLWILSVSVGTAYGCIFTAAPSIVRTVYPVADFGRNWGLVSWFSAIGALVFTPLFGYLTDREATKQQSPVCYGRACWEGVFALSAVSTLMAAGIVVVLWRGWWRGKV